MSEGNGDGTLEQVHEPADLLPDIDPSTLSYGQQLTWERQERFLDAFARFGTVTKAVEAAGINIHSVHYWDKGDKIGFTERYRYARRAFVDKLENMVLDRLEDPQGNRGSDVLLIARLNKEDPEHWTRNLKLTHDVPNELIQQLRRLQDLKPAPTPKGLGPGAVDQEERMPWE